MKPLHLLPLTALTSALSAQFVWTRHDLGIEERHQHAMAFDGANQKVLLFGGLDHRGQALGDSWLWDGTDWAVAASAQSPLPRRRHAMAWDSHRLRITMFGGDRVSPPLGSPPLLSDTWEWDGTTWSQRTTQVSPGPRMGHAMCYDSTRRRTVLFGGPTDETWEWDGATWILRAWANNPPIQAQCVMAYDTIRRQTVLHGASTWHWDGVTWSDLRPATTPTGTPQAMAFDGTRGVCVLVTSTATAWSWNGANWATSSAPSILPRTGMALTWSPARNAIVMFGGSNTSVVGDTWETSAGTWSMARHPSRPSPSHPARLVYDEARSTAVLVSDATWEWNGQRWQRLLESVPWTAIGSEGSVSVCYDGHRQAVVAAAYNTSRTVRGMWSWNGVTWTTLPITPDFTTTFSIGYDPTQGIVLTSGSSQGTYLLSNANNTWSQINSTPPPGQGCRTTVWDDARQRLCLMSFPVFELASNGWIARSPGGVTPILEQCAYDPARGRIAFRNYNTLLEWDGQNWLLPPTTGTPPNAPSAEMAWTHDSARGEHICYAAGGPSQIGRGDTFTLRSTNRPSAASYGQGCSGSGGTPVLQRHGAPVVGANSFEIILSSAPIGSQCIIAIGLGPASVPIGGACILLVSTIVASPFSYSNGSGSAVTTFPIPNAPSLAGIDLHAQGFTLDSGSPTFFSASQGLRITIGD